MPVYTDIYAWIRAQEVLYKRAIPVNEKWNWSMHEHILLTELYSCSQLSNGKDDFTPVRNITRPILNVQHRTEDIEVKDVQLYVNDSEKYHLSFLVKKYHDNVFVVENNIDEFFDELNVSRIDFGAGLSKQLNKPCPEVVPLQSIVFCDQSDILSGPIGIKHFYSPDQLLEMGKVGWGEKANGATISLEDLIVLSREEMKKDERGTITATPGRYIEVYEIHGNLPKAFYNSDESSTAYETRIYICAFYGNKNTPEKTGVVLYTALEKESPFKIIKRDPIHGRALGWGGAEELFEDQVWTNYDMIRMQDMLDAASKTILQSDDPTVTQKQKVRDMENLTVVNHAVGTAGLSQVDTYPRNMKLFDNHLVMLENHAKEMGAAQDPLQGVQPSSGTPFASLQAQIQQGLGLHQYRRGIYAKHLEEIYKDWIIPHIIKEIVKGHKFLAELTLDELQYVQNCVITYKTNEFIKNVLLNEGRVITQDEVDAFKQAELATFQKKGNKHFIEILKGEFKDVNLGVKVSIAGKSKDTLAMMDKINSVLKFMFANPYLLQSPPIAKLFNQMIDLAGMEPIDLSQFQVPALPTRRMTETLDYKDLALPPTEEQKAFLDMAGVKTGQPQV